MLPLQLSVKTESACLFLLVVQGCAERGSTFGNRVAHENQMDRKPKIIFLLGLGRSVSGPLTLSEPTLGRS